MSKKLITSEGKTELLRLGFASKEAGGAFTYMALGVENSAAAQGLDFVEANASGYQRVQTEVVDNTDQSITISATFKEENYAPTDAQGVIIKEIGLCNDSRSGTFFMYSEVPNVPKTGDVSLEYTVIISID